jgi:hypothetical protein
MGFLIFEELTLALDPLWAAAEVSSARLLSKN